MPPLTSTAHSHYQKVKINGVTRQRCLRCKVQTYADSTSTTVLLKHWKKCKATAVPASSMSSSTSSSQSLLSSSSASAAALAVNADAPVVTSHRRVYGPLDTAFSTASNLQLRPALAELFAIHTLPHHIIESAAFHAAVDAIRASTERLPNRRQLRAEQDVVAQRLRARVLNKLRNYCRSSPVTVALDGWTNVRRDKVTNVVILCGGAAYYWCSIVNSTASNTAAWMREPVANVINELREEGLIVAGLSTDNEEVNRALHSQLVVSFPFLIRSPCAAHILQLCVHGSLNLEEITPVMLGMQELLRQFNAKAARLKLKNLQLAASKTAYELIMPCDTRWSSHLMAARRLLQLRSFVDMVFLQPLRFWDTLAEIIRYLEPFQVATDVMQNDTSTLYDLYQQFNIVLRHVQDLPATSCFYAVKDKIVDIIRGHWQKHVNLDAVVISAQLSFDASVTSALPEHVDTARHWFLSFAAQYAWYYNLTTHSSIEQIKMEAMDEWSNFLGRTPGSCFQHLSDEVAMLRAKHMAEHCVTSRKRDSSGNEVVHNYTRWQPKAVWIFYLQTAPVISHAAVALLSVAASEAAVERTFSAQGLVHSKRRNRLLDETVEREMFIKFNSRALDDDQSTKQRGNYIELSEDMEEVEDVPRLDCLFAARQQQQPADDDGFMHAADADDGKEELLESPPVISQIPPPAPPADPVQDVVRKFVKQFKVSSAFRFKEHHQAALSALGAECNPPLQVHDVVMQRMVMAYVRAEPEAAAALYA